MSAKNSSLLYRGVLGSKNAVEFIVRIVAATAAIVPFLGAIRGITENLDACTGDTIKNNIVFLPFCFGIMYASTTDLVTSVIAFLIVYKIFELDTFWTKESDGKGTCSAIPKGVQDVMDFTRGFRSLIGWDLAAARRALRQSGIALSIEARQEFDKKFVSGRLQLIVEDGVVMGVKKG